MTPHMPYFMSRLPHHPSLHRYTWRIGVVLTGLFMLELNETFCIGSKYIYKQVGINFRTLRNQPVLQDSSMTLKRTGGVLTGLFMSELNETFSRGSKYIFQLLAIYFNGQRDQPVFQDSRVRLGGQVES